MIILLKPFELEQKIFVYNGETKVAENQVLMDEFGNAVLAIAEAHHIDQVDISGPRSYSEKAGEWIRSAELYKYNSNHLTINYI